MVRRSPFRAGDGIVGADFALAEGVYLADSAAWPGVPAMSPTFTIMANAMRIAERASRLEARDERVHIGRVALHIDIDFLLAGRIGRRGRIGLRVHRLRTSLRAPDRPAWRRDSARSGGPVRRARATPPPDSPISPAKISPL